MTIERISEILSKLDGMDRIDLFCHFEQLLNPHPVQVDGVWNEKAANWQEMFAQMCGYGIAKNVKPEK